MKKTLFILMVALFFSALSFAQLTGVKTIPGDYSTVAAAITALNASGVGTGGVTFNVAAGHTETFASPTAGRITTLTGSSANPIVFQKSGAGNNPLLTSGTGNSFADAIIAIAGCDYITFNGIDVRDKPANVSVGTMMEWGYAILKNSGTDGSQNITIKNCTITLKKIYDATKGIYSNNHTLVNTDQLVVTASTGTNSNLKIFSNTFTNCYTGTYLSGYNHTMAPYMYYDQNNEIGKDGGNIITNVAGQTDPGYGIYTIYQNNLTVANNNITSTMGGLSQLAKPYGIFLSTALNASFDLYNNYVSMQYSGDQYSDFYAIYGEMGGSGTNNTVNIYNNTVTNCTYPTAEQGWIYYLKFQNLGVTTNIYGNVVSNNTLGSTSLAAVGRIDYMWFQKTNDTQGPMEIYNNTVTGNTRFCNFVVGQPMHYLAAGGNGSTLECHDNLIDSNIANSDHAIQGLYITFNDSEYKKVYNNTITNITEIRGAATGLYNYHGTLGYFYNNKIQHFVGKSSSPSATINGIYQTDLGTEMYFFNNMITDLENPGAEAILGYDWNMLNGIYIENTLNKRGFYNNTVFLNATITGNQTNYGSSALCGVSLYNVDLRNNILINTSANKGPEGKTVAIRERISNYLTGFTSNYNNLNAGTPTTKNLIFWDGITSAQTLNAYKTVVYPQELQSKTEMSPFVNVSTQPWDVHLKTDQPTQCEAGGVVMNSPFPIIVDIDGNPRYPNPGYPLNPAYFPMAPDIGADEIGGIANDITPPSIAYTPLYNTSLTSSRILLAEINDGTGVPNSGIGKPVLYWKINNGVQQATQGLWISGSTYSFTFGAGTSLGDIVSYYIVAQDETFTGNPGSFPWIGASGFTTNPPACTTPPTTPSSYSIIQSISGTFHVGVGKTYTTLTNAINDLNSKSITGSVTFLLDDNSYPNETYPIIFEPNGGSSSVNTVTIRANTGAFPVISGLVEGTGLFMFKGIDYVTIDGSDGVTTEKRITIENSSHINNSYTIGITNNGVSDPSTNITLKNCIVLGNNTDILMETYLIVFNTNAGSNGGGYDNVLIDNNWLKRSKNGIFSSATFSNRNHNLVISNNTIGSPAELDYITRWGIVVEQSNNALITGNDIMGPATTVGTYALFGILYSNSSNTKITKNKIHDWISSGPGSFGIKCQNDDPTTFTEISNNLMYNIGAYGLNPGVSANMAAGIWVRHGGNMKIWNNTILLTGDYLYGGDSYAPSSTCIAFWNQTALNANNIDIRNNILQNSMTNSFPNPDPLAQGKAYGIMITDKVTFSVLDNNDYYIDGYQGQIAQKFCAGGLCMIDYPTLASWQAYTGMEANSMTVNPLFTSPTNLIPTTILMNNEGVYIPSVPTDYTGKYRSNPPDMGAYEFAVDQVLELNVFLEGSYNSSTNAMNTNLLMGGYVPNSQPYNPALPYFGNFTPDWLYTGTESISPIPDGVVDWVIVQLRDAASAGTAGPWTIIPGGTKAALLKSDGTIVDIEGHPGIIFAGVPVTQSLFVVVYHRNHLGIISANAVTQSGGIYSYDFTTGVDKVFGGTNGYKQIDTDPVTWGMIGADGNGDGSILNSDVTNAWKVEAGEKAYSGADYNLNIQIDNRDKNDIWVPNFNKSSQIPQ